MFGGVPPLVFFFNHKGREGFAKVIIDRALALCSLCDFIKTKGLRERLYEIKKHKFSRKKSICHIR
ncbi:MAG: hypothetical protein ACI8YQ_002803 [Polaribacter sp.]|jgi:hypothetical protein